jgi:hypothetical protein
MNENRDVPYIVYEGSMARTERHIKRLVIALIVAIIMICISNLAWLCVWNSYEYVGDSDTITYTQDGEGNNVIGDKNNLYEPINNDKTNN